MCKSDAWPFSLFYLYQLEHSRRWRRVNVIFCRRYMIGSLVLCLFAFLFTYTQYIRVVYSGFSLLGIVLHVITKFSTPNQRGWTTITWMPYRHYATLWPRKWQGSIIMFQGQEMYLNLWQVASFIRDMIIIMGVTINPFNNNLLSDDKIYSWLFTSLQYV